MYAIKSVIGLIAIGALGVALAEEESHVKIVVASDDGDKDGIHMQFDSDHIDFNLRDMQVGENQAVVDDQGRTMLITRETDGYTFDIEGKSIKLPLIGGGHKDGLQLHGDHDQNIEVHVERSVIEADGDQQAAQEVKVVTE